jgi:hypothetical protein
MDEREKAQIYDAFHGVLAQTDPDAQVLVEAGSRDLWHVTAVSETFANQTVTERNKKAHVALRKLGPALALRITLVMLLTPQEYDEIAEHRRLFADA